MNTVSTAVGGPIKVPYISIVPSGTSSNPAIATVAKPGTTNTYPTSMPAVSAPAHHPKPVPAQPGSGQASQRGREHELYVHVDGWEDGTQGGAERVGQSSGAENSQQQLDQFLESAHGGKQHAHKHPEADEQAYFGHYVGEALYQGSYRAPESQARRDAQIERAYHQGDHRVDLDHHD